MPAILKPSNFIWGGDGLGHQLTYLAGGGGEGGFINQELPLAATMQPSVISFRLRSPCGGGSSGA